MNFINSSHKLTNAPNAPNASREHQITISLFHVIAYEHSNNFKLSVSKILKGGKKGNLKYSNCLSNVSLVVLIKRADIRSNT